MCRQTHPNPLQLQLLHLVSGGICIKECLSFKKISFTKANYLLKPSVCNHISISPIFIKTSFYAADLFDYPFPIYFHYLICSVRNSRRNTTKTQTCSWDHNRSNALGLPLSLL